MKAIEKETGREFDYGKSKDFYNRVVYYVYSNGYLDSMRIIGECNSYNARDFKRLFRIVLNN